MFWHRNVKACIFLNKSALHLRRAPAPFNTPTDPGPVTIRVRGCEKQIPSINSGARWECPSKWSPATSKNRMP